MKITLWQQFSSNHSASFTVVGMFDTPDAAEQAETELQTMLTAIEGWHRGEKRSYPLAIQGKKSQPREDLTPPEYHFAEQYQIEWPRPVEWITQHDPGDLTLSRMDHVVFLSSFNSAFQGPQPFDELMAKLGGQVTVQAHSCDDFDDTLVVLNLSCTAPDPARAEWIDLMFQDYRDSTIRNHVLFTWIDKYTDEYWPEGTDYNQTERTGAQLTFKNVALSDVGYLPNFIQYLANEGCTDFTFEFHYISEDT